MKFKDGCFEMTEAEYQDYEEGNQGLCRACGESRGYCEPDACNYECEDCGERQVFGVPELLIMGLIEFVGED